MWKERNIAFLTLDIISVIGAVFLSYYLLIKLGFYMEPTDRLLNIIILPLITIFVFAYTDMYNFFSYIDRVGYIYRTTKSIFYTFVIYLIFNFIFRHTLLSKRKLLFAIFIIVSIILYIERIIIYNIILKILPKKKIVIYVPKGDTKGLERFISDNKNINAEIVKVIKNKDNLRYFLGNNYTFILVLHTKEYEEIIETLKMFMNKEKVLLFSEINKKIKNVPYWFYFGDTPLIPFRWSGRSKGYLLLKRVIDIVGGIFAVILFSPFIFLISILIKATSKGPVFFRQERLKSIMEKFICLKFRSMYINADESIHEEYVKNLIKGKKRDGDVFKITKDKRVTPVGYVIRKMSLDEIPQFFNVIKGDLSLVGPRPPTEYEVKEYKEWHKERLSVKQGITGFWQVFGRSQLPFDESVFLDIYYAYNRSFLMDLHLIMQTLPNIVFGQGAY